jgi:sugar/nucleoside kinase (ribokinase family)
MSDTRAWREECAAQLEAAVGPAAGLRAFVGLDGFVDEIIHVVDKRESAEKWSRMPTIADLARRLEAAVGRSTNLEVVSQLTKLGGNGPIMANALASFGLKVTYLGVLGYPNLHPVFEEFARRADVHSIAPPGYTDALEFEDGKVMVGKHQALKEMTWDNIQTRFGRDRFVAHFTGADFVAFVNWTMLPYMSDIWEAVLKEVCPANHLPRRRLFIDLADPEKRTPPDIQRALGLIAAFEQYFDVIFGMNEKESGEIGRVLGLNTGNQAPEGLAALGQEIRRLVPVNTVLIHPVSYALAVHADGAQVVQGPFTPKPRITTGAGDHFNAGFCLGRLLGLDNRASLLCGVATSGFYVRQARSPSLTDLADLMRHWPADNT